MSFSSRELLLSYFSKYRIGIFIGVFALIIISLLDAFLPFVIKQSIDSISLAQPSNELLWWVLVYLICTVVLAFLRFTWRTVLASVSAKVGFDLRKLLLQHTLKLPLKVINQKRSGELTTLVNTDIESVRYIYDIGIVIFVDAVCGVLFYPTAMLLLAPKLAIMLLTPLLAIPLIAYINDRRIHKIFKKIQESTSELTSAAQESVLGLSIIRSFAKEHIFIERYSKLGKQFVERSLKLAGIEASFSPSLEFTVVVAILIHILIGGHLVIDGALTVGTFVAFIRYLQSLAWPMQALGVSISVIQKALVGSERLSKMLIEPTEDNVKIIHSNKKYVGSIVFNNVSFGYEQGNFSLKNVSLDIQAGEKIAFLGEIGSGKSTLLSLLPRLFELTSGKIFLDGVDINEIPLNELRSQIGFVAQEPLLFRRSIRDNIAYPYKPQLQNQNRLIEATKEATIYEEILSLPNQYDTRLGERGVNISGGQKQRISIARALYQKCPVLIFDDALSAVDVRAEREIINTIRASSQKQTILLATHRLASTKIVDRIVVLHRGQVIQVGTHNELYKDSSGWYRRFYEEQMMEEELLHKFGVEV
jgi:ATP-binding cassette, subfamily B, multidrug efflux pump